MRNLYSFVDAGILASYNALKELYNATNGKYEKRMKKIIAFFEKYDECNQSNEMVPVKFWVMLMSAICITELRGKLDGITSLSTSPLLNAFCNTRKKCGKLICKYCYSIKEIEKKMYASTMLVLETNSIILNNILIPEKYWELVEYEAPLNYGRIESHGDVATITCAMNYINFIKAHENVNFTVWSKNLYIWNAALKALGKPKNMIFTYSSEEVNVISEIPEEYRWFVDHRFTCYDLDYAKEHNIHINCGFYDEKYREINHQCKYCLKCYDKKYLDIFDIFEIVKGDKTIKKAPKDVREAFENQMIGKMIGIM